jgi:hypothetical protein
LYDSEKIQPFGKVSSSAAVKNCLKGLLKQLNGIQIHKEIKTVVASTEEVE